VIDHDVTKGRILRFSQIAHMCDSKVHQYVQSDCISVQTHP
jgi:hypothetical protein